MLVIWVLMKTQGDPELGKLIQNFRRILYEIRTRKDLFLNSASGMLGGRLITHDIYKKTMSKEYNYLMMMILETPKTIR